MLAAGQSSTPEAVRPDNPVTFSITHEEATKPQVVRIFNLDEGTRVIVLPPAHMTVTELSEKGRAAIIFNLGEGTREVELWPAAK